MERNAYRDRMKDKPCADCGGRFDPVCMDFDHLPGHEKLHKISDMIADRVSWKKTAAEIAKCEVVCANCHRLRTKRRLNGKQ